MAFLSAGLLFVAGALVVVAVAIMALLRAVKHAEDGYEDESGFHGEKSAQNPGSAPQPAKRYGLKGDSGRRHCRRKPNSDQIKPCRY